MGKVLILSKYIFLIYSSDIHERRRHIHVTYNRSGFKRSCKFWLETEIALDALKKGEFTTIELNEIEKLLREHKNELFAQLELFYANLPVKALRK